ASDDVPNLQRTLISVPVYSIVSAYGLILLLHSAKSLSRHLFRLSVLIPVCIIVFSLFYYLVQYYTQARNYRTWYRQDGYKELVNKVSNLSAKYRQVIVTNRESAPTIFFLFYNKYSPSLFQKAAFGSDHRSFDRMNFGKYIFTQEECPLKAKRDDGTEILISKEVLYVNSALCKEFPVGSRLLAEIRRADSSSVFYILDSINND
ncbi:MAG: hypothetical protein Q7K55_02985, partial [Candidatus Levybacteria bacterium]|nr:hypothetical protein [Candidatus Levybacteria bacterium]